ncbi:hypothetical protein BGY98DRAFT_376830 [Russula aff. rugulosa BPL654]|nr:hypothetical protein BGY98DRAFT_376830 [Russula aff. rugulosa BPL654]
MTSTAYSSRGQVEHNLFMMGGIISFVIELKLGHEGRATSRNYSLSYFVNLNSRS